MDLATSSNRLNQKIGSKLNYSHGNGSPRLTHGTTDLKQKAQIKGDDNSVNQNMNVKTINDGGPTSEVVSQGTLVTGDHNTVDKSVRISDINKDGAVISSKQDNTITGSHNEIEQALKAQRANDENSKVNVVQESMIQGDDNQEITQVLNDFSQNKNNLNAQNLLTQTNSIVGNDNTEVHQALKNGNSIDNSFFMGTQGTVIIGDNNNKITQNQVLADTNTPQSLDIMNQNNILQGNGNDNIHQELRTSRSNSDSGATISNGQTSTIVGDGNHDMSQSQTLQGKMRTLGLLCTKPTKFLATTTKTSTNFSRQQALA